MADTPSYFTAWKNIKNGSIDIYRTPVYPIFIGIITEIVGVNHNIVAINVVQAIIFIFSISALHSGLVMLTRQKRISLLCTAFYALYPGVTNCIRSTLTESLSISLMAFLLYAVVSTFRNGANIKKCLTLCLLISLLVMLRPSFIFLLPICAIAAIVCIIKKVKCKFIVSSSLFIPIILALIYCGNIYYKCGIFSPSIVSTNNLFAITKKSGIADLDAINNCELRDDLKKYWSNNDSEENVFPYFAEKYGYSEINKALNESIGRHTFSLLCQNIIKSSKMEFFENGGLKGNFQILYTFFGIPLKLLYWMLLIFVCVIIFTAYKRYEIPWLSIIVALVAWGNVLMANIGADNEWPRLCSTSFPFYIATVAILLSTLQLRHNALKNIP